MAATGARVSGPCAAAAEVCWGGVGSKLRSGPELTPVPVCGLGHSLREPLPAGSGNPALSDRALSALSF